MPKCLPDQATYRRVIIEGDEGNADFLKCAELIAECILIRGKYQMPNVDAEDLSASDLSSRSLKMVDGVYALNNLHAPYNTWTQYIEHVRKVFSAIDSNVSGYCLSTAHTRLTILEEEFELYRLLNTPHEKRLDKEHCQREIGAHSVKVDNNVRLQTGASAISLLERVIKTCIECREEPVSVDPITHQTTTLADLLAQFHIDDPRKLSVEGLGLHPPLRKRFHRFDALDHKLSMGCPGSATILKLFLSHATLNGGKFFADIVRPILESHERSSQHIVATEYRISILGASADEWAVLARWIDHSNFTNFTRNMWVIQIPRLAQNRATPDMYDCKTNEDQLRHIFFPMFMATIDPHNPEYHRISALLNHVGALGIVSDETQRLKNFSTEPTPPSKIPWSENTSDYWFFYYVWANLRVLNILRAKLGLNTIQFRPTCGEATQQFDSLVCSYILADSICQGVRLRDCWILQYLYMFSRIGIVMSPLSNNTLNVPYTDNPFPTFFKRGLNVSLGTDEPLHIHHSAEPLLEEYGTATKIYQLSPTDANEIARNSILISSFPAAMKALWLGPNYARGVEGNDSSKSNVCDFRLHFRNDCLLHEQTVLNLTLSHAMKDRAYIIREVRARRQKVFLRGEAADQIKLLRHRNQMDRRIAFSRIDIFGSEFDKKEEMAKAGQQIRFALLTRNKYIGPQQQIAESANNVDIEEVFSAKRDFPEKIWEYNNYYGVFLRSRIGIPPTWPEKIPTIYEFIQDFQAIHSVAVQNRYVRAVANHRLKLLEHKYQLHLAMNIGREAGKKEEKEFNNRDVFTAHKVDGNVQLEAGMNARSLLYFFIDKAKHHRQDVVFEQAGTPVTLSEFLAQLEVDVEHLTFDELSDLFISNQMMHDLFLSADNLMLGRYFAELAKTTLDLYKLDAYTFAENRLMITGKNPGEWENLAAWFDRYGMASLQNRWMIQIPRGYRKLRQEGHVRSFGEFLENLFQPLWEASLHPGAHPKFHYFLSHVSGFDTIDSEMRMDLPLGEKYPHEWTEDANPPYNYYLYYFWANISSLNEFRALRGLNVFNFRPQCGESGSVEHLVGGFLLCSGINHGVTLSQYPSLEYLWYVAQIGITMSPLSETETSVAYLENPFPKFFSRGLNVSLSTNRPLHYHFTQEPLIEEYSIAAKTWELSFNDLCEIARNSVLQSGFRETMKKQALGPLYFLHSALGNNPMKSRLSDIRVAYRFEVYHTELNYLEELVSEACPRAMRLLEEEKIIHKQATGLNADEVMNDEAAVENARRQIEELQKEIVKVKADLQQMSDENASMVATIKKNKKKSVDISALLLALTGEPNRYQI